MHRKKKEKLDAENAMNSYATLFDTEEVIADDEQ